MSQRARIFMELALAMGLALATGVIAQVALAQKPPAPKPPPPSGPPTTNPGQPTPLNPSNGTLGQPTAGELVMFLQGHVATDDGTDVPRDVIVERVCNARVLQQVYAAPGGYFSMQLGSVNDSYVDATAEPPARIGQSNNAAGTGIPRRQLTNCELRASVSGFTSKVVNLVDISPGSSNVDVGGIVVHRTEKIKGATLSAAPYQAPKDARKAYENGIEAERKGKLADARQYFEKAVEIYPKYTSAWFQLGAVLRNLAQKEPARDAFSHATAIDSKFLPPYLSLAAMAFEAREWTQVLNLTNHVMELDPLRYADVKGYIVDLDPVDYAEAYFYNSAANYRLDRIEDAEKSGLRAERLDTRPRFPQLHLLLAEIFARKTDYARAISETKIYLELMPHAKNADQVRGQLAELEKLNGPAS
jgi:tetratricopeptide (TPR) repeat protein